MKIRPIHIKKIISTALLIQYLFLFCIAVIHFHEINLSDGIDFLTTRSHESDNNQSATHHPDDCYLFQFSKQTYYSFTSSSLFDSNLINGEHLTLHTAEFYTSASFINLNRLRAPPQNT